MIKRVIDGAIAASGASETIDTGSGRTVNVQVCGDAFTGQVVVKQGADPDWLLATKTLDLAAYSDGSEYYTLDRSTRRGPATGRRSLSTTSYSSSTTGRVTTTRRPFAASASGRRSDCA